MTDEEVLHLRQAFSDSLGGKPRVIGLPRRTRVRLWRTRQVDSAGIWLAGHGHYRAAAVLWRVRLR